jgi:hypothetical protein
MVERRACRAVIGGGQGRANGVRHGRSAAQVIASMVPPLGGEGSRPQLPARLVAQMRIAVMGHLSADQLQAVYDHLLQRALAGRLRCARGAASAQTDVHMLSRCMTTVFHATADAVAAATAAIGGDRLQQQQQGLPALTTRHLAAWVDGLTRCVEIPWMAGGGG